MPSRLQRIDVVSSRDLARLWTKHQASVAAFINSLVRNFDETEELLQETAAQLFDHVERYDDSRPFLAWALGIARNVVLKHRRQLARDRHVFTDQALDHLAQAFEEQPDEPDRLAKYLALCREKLSQRAKEVCRLRYELNLGRTEIAVRQNSTPPAVKIMLHRIREQLRECIERHLRQEGPV